MLRHKSKWSSAVVAGGLGLLMMGLQWSSGHLGRGLVSLAILWAFGALLVLGGRSEAVRELRGDDRDERWAQIQLQATAFAGRLLILAVVVAVIVELAEGHDMTPYTWLASLGGFSYLGAVLVLRTKV